MRLLSEVLTLQPSVAEIRAAWDEIPESVFTSPEHAIAVEELAVRRGCFRRLVLAGRDAMHRNAAVLFCFSQLQEVPRGREIATVWTHALKSKFDLPRDTPAEDDESIGVVERERMIAAHSNHDEFLNVLSQQRAIIDRLRRNDIVAARRFCNELVEAQLSRGDRERAAKTLCRVAQEAKLIGCHSVQLEWATRAVDVCPTDPWAHGQAADAYIEFFRLDEASDELRLAEAYGDEFFAATGRARILRLQGRLDEALVAFDAARRDFAGVHDEKFAWLGVAETLRAMWRLEDALSEYDRALVIFPNDIVVKCGRASILTDLGRVDEALAAYRQVISYHGSERVALNGEATVLRAMGRLEEALEAYDNIIELFPADSVAFCGRAAVLHLRGDLTESLSAYGFARTEFPHVSVAYGGFAEVLNDLGRWDEALAAYEEAVAIFPLDNYLANGLANTLKEHGRAADALGMYDEAVRKFPHDLIAKVGRANLLKRMRHFEEAIDAYDQILAVWGQFPAARHAKASILAVLGRYEEALALLPDGIPASKDDWIASHVRGMIMLRRGETAEARSHFEKALGEIPFARERAYFSNALAIAELRAAKFTEAAKLVREDAISPTARIILLHALAGDGSQDVRACYDSLVVRCPPFLTELRDEIASKYRLRSAPPAHNDNWIFEKEGDALLLEAA